MTAAEPRFPRFAALVERHRRALLVAMLLLLHLAVLQGVGNLAGRMILLGHFGLFLLWQPIVRTRQPVDRLTLLILAASIGIFVLFLNWWLMVVWIMVLAAIAGGKVFFYAARWVRLSYLLALGFLLLEWLILVVPMVIPPADHVPEGIDTLARLGLFLLLPVMLALPRDDEERQEVEVIDFFSSIVLFLLLGLLLLGCLAFMLLRGLDYVEALSFTLLSLAAVLLVLGAAWSPRVGFSGIGVLFTRYVLSVGLPFEQWLHFLADQAVKEDSPAGFLDQAFAGLGRLPWILGGEWYSEGRSGRFGELGGSRSEFRHGPLRLALYTRQSLTPALRWHFDLLARLLGEFYQAKLQAEQLQHMGYLRAVHETGARLTHDVKNLLQSLNSLCFAAAVPGAEGSPEFQALLRRQLPVITQRLQQTLEKLRRPEEDVAQRMPAGEWWDDLARRYAGDGVVFVAEELDREAAIPPVLFSSAAENLLQNVMDKRRLDPRITATVRFATRGRIELSVQDSGPAMPEEVAARLFRAPLPSAGGLGIGLYQVARFAQMCGFELAVARNRPGAVCVALRQREDEAAAGRGAPPAAAP